MIYLGVFSLLLAVLFYLKYRFIFNPASLFLGLWGCIIILYSFRFYGLYGISDSTAMVYTVGIIGFALGSISISKRQYISLKNMNIPDYYISRNLNIALITLACVSIIVFAIYAVQMMPYWIAGGASAVKLANIKGGIQLNGITSMLYTYIATPVQFISVLIIAIGILFNKNVSPTFAVLSGIMFVLKQICTASKLAVALPILVVVMALLYKQQLIKSRIWGYVKGISTFKKIIILIVILIPTSYIISRLSRDGTWIESLYYYLVGCMPCSDNALNTLNRSGNYYYGVTSFNGFLRVGNAILRIVGIDAPWNEIMDESFDSMLMFENSIYIANGVRYNAFISCFSYFYSDGGMIGVGLLSFLFGLYSKFTYRKFIRDQNIYSFLNYFLCCYMILTSMVRFQTFLVAIPLVYIYVWIIFNKRKRVKLRVRT